MKYSEKINKLHTDFTKKYHRRDETFAMGTIKVLVKELESGEYDDTQYSNDDVEMICKYLCEKYFERMSLWKEKLEEQAKQNGFYY